MNWPEKLMAPFKLISLYMKRAQIRIYVSKAHKIVYFTFLLISSVFFITISYFTYLEQILNYLILNELLLAWAYDEREYNSKNETIQSNPSLIIRTPSPDQACHNSFFLDKARLQVGLYRRTVDKKQRENDTTKEWERRELKGTKARPW